MDLIVTNPVTAQWGNSIFRCAIGKGGLVEASAKKEGDLKTPVGLWAIRNVFYRADRMEKPHTCLPIRALNPDDGWCEKPEDDQYNQLVRTPYKVPVDQMWRADHLYDIVAVLGYNDAPVIAGKGSAIFLHLIRPDFGPSAGCITLEKDDLLKLLKEADSHSCVDVRAG